MTQIPMEINFDSYMFCQIIFSKQIKINSKFDDSRNYKKRKFDVFFNIRYFIINFYMTLSGNLENDSNLYTSITIAVLRTTDGKCFKDKYY